MALLERIVEEIRKRPSVVMIFLAFIFFWLYAALYLVDGNVFLSPDENSTWVFARHFSETQTFTIKDPAGEIPGVLKPRSVNLLGDNYVPGAFLGLPLLLGYVMIFFGPWVADILPALLATLGVLSFYGLLRRVFSEDMAFVAGLLLFFLPPWWYFASRGFLPNVSTISLAIMAGYLLARAHELCDFPIRSLLIGALSGLTLGAAVSIRPVEVVWIAVVILAVLVFYKKFTRANILIIALLASVILPLVVGYWQNETYNGWFVTGYDQLNAGESAESPVPWQIVSKILFPFGIDVGAALWRFWLFAWQLFWPQLLLTIVGVVAWLKGNKTGAQRLYLTLFLAVTFYLVFYYGSWEISDHPEAGRVSIGISYVRYWLPIFLAALPFQVFGLRHLVGWFSKSRSGFVLVASIVVVFLQSLFLLFYWQDDNLSRMRQNIVEYQYLRQQVFSLTNPGAVIISERNDKLFWPQRDVVHYQDQDYSFVKGLPGLLNKEAADSQKEVYWMTSLPRDHVEVIKERYFTAQHLTLVEPVKISEVFALYQVLLQE